MLIDETCFSLKFYTLWNIFEGLFLIPNENEGYKPDIEGMVDTPPI
jgi:hypothetical protein